MPAAGDPDNAWTEGVCLIPFAVMALLATFGVCVCVCVCACARLGACVLVVGVSTRQFSKLACPKQPVKALSTAESGMAAPPLTLLLHCSRAVTLQELGPILLANFYVHEEAPPADGTALCSPSLTLLQPLDTPSRVDAGDASHAVIPKTVKFGAPSLIGEMQRRPGGELDQMLPMGCLRGLPGPLAFDHSRGRPGVSRGRPGLCRVTGVLDIGGVWPAPALAQGCIR